MTTSPRAADDGRVAGPLVPQVVLTAVGALRRPIVISHVVPDADALGAMLGMTRALTSVECKPTAAVPPGSVSQRLSFLLDWARVPIATGADFKAADGFIVLDTAKKPRANVGPELKESDWAAGRPLVNIDHHETNTRFGTVNWIVGDASSSSELAYHLLRAAACPMDAVTASLLYAGIQTDTLGFSLATATASAFCACADLVVLGANVGELGERLCRSHRKGEFELIRRVYANTRIVGGGRVAYSTLSFEEILEAGCTAADIDDQINIPRSLDGVQLAMLFSEGNRGKTRINFRGSGPVTVVELAQQFKGGGHSQAAGAVLDGGLLEIVDRVVPKAVEHVEQFPE